jgi:hypothetical protein
MTGEQFLAHAVEASIVNLICYGVKLPANAQGRRALAGEITRSLSGAAVSVDIDGDSLVATWQGVTHRRSLLGGGFPWDHSTAIPSPPSAPPKPTPRGLRFTDAYQIQLALNAALLTPDIDRPSQLLTVELRAQLEAAIDAATIRPDECSHGDWEWPRQRCPSCGLGDVRKEPTR